jgi:glycosyltransferase involved in cell wall biosynthesis
MIVGPRFIWLHFPKCAGSTVELALRRLAAGREDVSCDPVITTSDLRQVTWHQNLRQRRERDRSLATEGKEIIANFRRLPDWILSRTHFAAQLLPDAVPTRQMLTAGRFYEADGSVKSADEELELYREEPVARWIRAEHLIEDFEQAFGAHFDLSSGVHREILKGRVNAADNYIRDIGFHFTSKELERLYLLNPAWAALESKLYGDIFRLPPLPSAEATARSTGQSIAAIIPMYNGAPYIENAIRSVLAQTVQPDELLIVDDGSTDDGREVVRNFGQAHLTLLTKENGGQSSARNYGVRHSTSSLIAFLDQDDAWHPHHLERLLSPFQERRNIPIGWSYSNLDEVDEQGRLVNRSVLDLLPITHPKRSLNTCLGQDMFVLPSASLVSRQAFDAVAGFDERLSGYEDDDLFLRIFRAGYDNVYINEPLSKWRIYSSSSSFSDRMRKSRMIYFDKLCGLFPDNRNRNLYYARDLIAPRFARSILLEYEQSLRLGDKSKMQALARDLQRVSRHLRGRRRLMAAGFSLAAQRSALGDVAGLAYRLLRRSRLRLF